MTMKGGHLCILNSIYFCVDKGVHRKKVIICCGDRAKVAILALQYAAKINKEVKIIFIEHLGMRAINQIKQDIKGNEIKGSNKIENTRKRLEVIAEKIEQQCV